MRERSDFCLGGRPLFALDPGVLRARVPLARLGACRCGCTTGYFALSAVRHPAVVEIETTLSQEWSRNSIRGPQCAFEMSMFKCPAVHKLTRN